MKPTKSVVAFGDPSTYVLNIASSPDGTKFACAGARTDGNPTLAVQDLATLHPLLALSHHTGPISDLCYVNPTSLLSSSMDGTVALWDLRAASKPAGILSRPAPAPEPDEDAPPRKKKRLPAGPPPICSVDCSTVSSSTNLIAYGTAIPDGGQDSMIVIWDPRSLNTPLATFSDSHSEDVTCVRFRQSPSASGSEELVTGGTDGVVNLFHVGTGIASAATSDEDKENDAIQMTIPLDSIARLGWAGKYVWGLTTTEQLFVADPNEGDVLLNLGDIRTKTASEYLVDCIFDASSERLYLYAGVAGNVRCFHVNLDGVSPATDGDLLEAHSDIVRGFATVRQQNGNVIILTGGEDGKVVSWI